MKLLIVEDNARMRKLIKSLVQEFADEIFECSDGSEVFTAYRLHRPDWVLMDIEMTHMDGFTASQHLIQSFPSAQIVIVTKYDDDNLRQEARLAGACGYVLKEDLLALKGILTHKPPVANPQCLNHP